MFRDGEVYTRDEIHDALGGSKQSYLPTVNGSVVCACLTPKLNPGAPRVILVGNGPKIIAAGEALASQTGRIPVFSKLKVNAWRYEGDFAVEGATTDRVQVEQLQRAAGRTDVRMAIFLKR